MRTLTASIATLIISLPAYAGTLNPAFVFIADGKGFGQPACSFWQDSDLGQVGVDKTAPNGPLLEGRMVFWAQHGISVTFTTYTGNCGGQTIATAATGL